MWGEASLASSPSGMCKTFRGLSPILAMTKKRKTTNYKQWEKWQLNELKVEEVVKTKGSSETTMNRENVEPGEGKI